MSDEAEYRPSNHIIVIAHAFHTSTILYNAEVLLLLPTVIIHNHSYKTTILAFFFLLPLLFSTASLLWGRSCFFLIYLCLVLYWHQHLATVSVWLAMFLNTIRIVTFILVRTSTTSCDSWSWSAGTVSMSQTHIVIAPIIRDPYDAENLNASRRIRLRPSLPWLGRRCSRIKHLSRVLLRCQRTQPSRLAKSAQLFRKPFLCRKKPPIDADF